MQRIWALIVVAIVGCAGERSLPVSDAVGQEPTCVDTDISRLPISEEDLRERITQLTGYDRGYEIDRICKLDGEYLVGIIPPEQKRHGIFSVLLIVNSRGDVRIFPSQ